MQSVGLHDSERDKMPNKSFPNLALMKISAYHKNRGDTVQWWDKSKTCDIVYSSKVFDFTPENPHLPPGTIKGGTGYGLFENLPHRIDVCRPDYSIYPNCDYAVGYLTRGCPNNCAWCVVPRKEGAVKPCANWQMLARDDSDKLVLLDNNILACDFGIRQLAELAESGYKIDLNQGMDITRVDEEIAQILMRIKWIKYIRFSCDCESKLPYFARVSELFCKYGISRSRVFIYVLVRQDLAEAERRVRELHRIFKSFNLYAQAERNIGVIPSKAQLEFAQRYVYRGLYKRETWAQYCARRGLPGVENYDTMGEPRNETHTFNDDYGNYRGGNCGARK
jgi:hypothetical protein